MTACRIKEIKQFMHILLGSDAFDKFSFEKARITTYCTFEIDGHIVPAFYEGTETKPDALAEFAAWQTIRPICFDLIKGKQTPVSFQFTLLADRKDTNRLLSKHNLAIAPESVRYLFVNIRYERGQLFCITGTSFSTFIADKSLEHIWDKTFQDSLDALHIDFEIQQ